MNYERFFADRISDLKAEGPKVHFRATLQKFAALSSNSC